MNKINFNKPLYKKKIKYIIICEKIPKEREEKMLKKKRIYIVPILGFSLAILIGAILLSLPACNNSPISFIDSLFVATSGICVDGFSTVVISEQFNYLGKIVLLILNEIGALGFMSLIVFILTLNNKKVKIADIILAGDSINDDMYAHIKERVKHIFYYTFTIEIIGAILLAIGFIPIYGFKEGIWYGIFHSVTAFCNAGFDIIGRNSLEYLKDDVYMNIVFMALIILGGIGFFVLEDLFACLKNKTIKKLQFHSKLVLSTTILVLFVSVLLIKLMEPSLTLLQACFTSVTLRTAGFSTVNMAECSQATRIIAVILMFIGGAPGSTSGGIRIVVFAILILTIAGTLRNKKETVIFYREINQNMLRKAVTITGLSMFVILVAVILMIYFDDIGLENIIFHCVSAFSATGLGIMDLSILNVFGKIILMAIMFIGRVGPITAVSLFIVDKKQTNNGNIKFVEGKLML